QIPLGISSNYVQSWDTTAAFRELYQNWKDSILDTFSVNRHAFQPCYSEDEGFISITLQIPSGDTGEKQTLGFIRYEKESGTVTVANACAQLQPEALQLGNTSKQINSSLAGCHGEGLKIAAMVLSRKGHRFNIYSNNCTWSFVFRGLSDRQLHCLLVPSTAVTPSDETNFAHDMDCFRPRIWRDVCVTIGSGDKPLSDGVSLDIFKSWLNVSLDIRGLSYPSAIVETDHGDLILDPKFQALDVRSYKFGYNFANGKVNRDRQRLVDTSEEANLLRQIWEAAIQKDEAVVLPRYVDLLRNFPSAPDVESADQLLESSTRSLIWKFLLSEAKGSDFYYCERYGSQSIEKIKNGLKKNPACLPDTLWNMLRSDSLIRTAHEEQIHLFQKATVCKAPVTIFARNIERGLKATLSLWMETKEMKIQFVNSENNDVDIVVDRNKKTLNIHQRWLSYEETHGKYRCRDFVPNDRFVCDHIIEEMIRAILGFIKSNEPGCLQVSWRHGETDCKTITFSDLNFTRAYFPMIARNWKSSFYGVPPSPVFPMGPTIVPQKRIEQIVAAQQAAKRLRPVKLPQKNRGVPT
ncbi:hypothetical protein BGW36DRAFT_303752, partial [Talaromyces proteolyticus]